MQVMSVASKQLRSVCVQRLSGTHRNIGRVKDFVSFTSFGCSQSKKTKFFSPMIRKRTVFHLIFILMIYLMVTESEYPALRAFASKTPNPKYSQICSASLATGTLSRDFRRGTSLKIQNLILQVQTNNLKWAKIRSLELLLLEEA